MWCSVIGRCRRVVIFVLIEVFFYFDLLISEPFKHIISVSVFNCKFLAHNSIMRRDYCSSIDCTYSKSIISTDKHIQQIRIRIQTIIGKILPIYQKKFVAKITTTFEIIYLQKHIDHDFRDFYYRSILINYFE